MIIVFPFFYHFFDNTFFNGCALFSHAFFTPCHMDPYVVQTFSMKLRAKFLPLLPVATDFGQFTST